MNRLGWWLMYGPWNIWNHPIVDENWIAIRCYQPQAHITSDASQVQFPHFGTLGTKMVIVQVQLAHVGTFSTSGQTKSITLSLVSFADLGASGSSVTALMTWPPGWKAGRKTWDTVETEEHGYSNGHIRLIRMAVGEQKMWGLTKMWDFLMSWAGHLRNTGNHFHRCQGTGGIISRTFRTTWILVMWSVREPPKIRLN